MLVYFERILIALLFFSVLGYVFSILIEKYYLKNNIIIIEKKNLTQDDLDEADIKEFVLNGEKVRAGDEIEIVTTSKDRFKGVLIGFIKKETAVSMITNKSELKKFNIGKIKNLKIISKYGKFFNSF